jgi:hypothetical protein
MSGFKRIPVKIDAATGCQINENGVVVRDADYFRLLFDETVILCCEFYDLEWSGGIAVMKEHPVAEDMALSAFGDCDFDPATPFMFLAEENSTPAINHVNAPDDWYGNTAANRGKGQISFRINTNTVRFDQALKAPGNQKYYFLIIGVPAGETEKSVLAYFRFKAENRPSSSAGAPASADTEYLNAQQTVALLKAAPEFQFSIDGATLWHTPKVAADLYYRERRLSGEWSDAVPFPLPNDAQYEYSVNGSTSWHDPYVSGDYYMRVSVDGGTTWSNAILFRVDGVNAFLYVAWASDVSGTDFSLTQGSLRYRAEKRTTTVIASPQASDFAGLWSLYIIGRLWSGTGTPGSGLGENGDNYLNSNNGDVYYKNGGAWSIIANFRGPAFSVDESGLLSAKSAYDTEAAGFSYLATDTGNLYIKNSATSGDWSAAIPFKGDKGDSLNPCGDWDDETEYSVNDLVSYTDGGSYVSITNNNTGNLPTDAGYWMVSASKGATGAAGETPLFLSNPFDSADLTAGVLTITHTQGLLKGLPCMVSYEISSGVWESHTLDSRLIQFSNNQITLDLSIFDIQAGQNWHYAIGGCGGQGEQGIPGNAHVSTRYAKGNISGAVTIDKANGDYQVCAAAGTVTSITISNLATETGMILRINNSGGYAVTWGSTVIIAATETGDYACAFYNDNSVIGYCGKGQII